MILIQAGNVRAFESFYDRHSSVAFNVAMRILNDSGRAAEATQEAFIGFWRQRANYLPERGAGKSWLFGMVRNRAIDTWRRERTQKIQLDDGGRVEQQPGPDDPERQSIERDESQRLRATLLRLPTAQRRVIELAYFGGLTHTEIAQRLDLPLGTAKGRIRLALTKLRTALDEEEATAISGDGPVAE